MPTTSVEIALMNLILAELLMYKKEKILAYCFYFSFLLWIFAELAELATYFIGIKP